MARYQTPFMLACIVLLATALRVYQIDRESFWLDEAFSYWVANSTAADVGITSANEVNPPLYYITLHYWVKIFGDSDKAIRLLSAMLGSLAIPVIYQIGRLLFNERFGLLAALFLTVSGFHIQYAQEARAYSLYFLLTSLSVFFVVLTSKKRNLLCLNWLHSNHCSVALLSQHSALYRCRYHPLLLGIGVASWRWSSVYRFLMATLVAFLAYAPYIPVYLSQARTVKEDFWTRGLTIEDVLTALQKLILVPQYISGLGPIQYGLIGLPVVILLLSLPALWDKEKKAGCYSNSFPHSGRNESTY